MDINLFRQFCPTRALKFKDGVLYADDIENGILTNPYTVIVDCGPDGDYALLDRNGNIFTGSACDLRMQPLAYIDDRPVYAGDTVYPKNGGAVLVISYAGDDGILGFHNTQIRLHPSALTLNITEPKQSSQKIHKWINVYKNGAGQLITALQLAFDSKKEAKAGILPTLSYVATVKVKIDA